jgi:hypothetical protein
MDVKNTGNHQHYSTTTNSSFDFSFSWLHKNAAVCHCQPLQDNFVVLQTVITKSSFGKFKALYPHVKVGKLNE